MLYPTLKTWLLESFTDVRVSDIGRGLACRSQGLTPRKLSFVWHAYRANPGQVISKICMLLGDHCADLTSCGNVGHDCQQS